MKMYDKTEVTIIDGMLVHAGDIITVDPRIVEQANRLETLMQKADYLDAQPEATPEPSLDGFVRKSCLRVIGEFVAKTPNLDAKVDEAMAIMDEIDGMEAANAANEMQQGFVQLIEFSAADYVIDMEAPVLVRFDTPTLGNPLELEPADVIAAIGYVCGIGSNANDDDDKDDED